MQPSGFAWANDRAEACIILHHRVAITRATRVVHNAPLDLELEERALDAFRNRYRALANAPREELQRGHPDTDTPEPSSGTRPMPVR